MIQLSVPTDAHRTEFAPPIKHANAMLDGLDLCVTPVSSLLVTALTSTIYVV